MGVSTNVAIVFTFLFFQFTTLAQQSQLQHSNSSVLTKHSLDSLFNLFTTIKSDEINKSDKIRSPNKCGLDIINRIKLNFDRFNSEQQEKISLLLSRPVLQTSIVSPSGFFRIHYDQTGPNAPAYNTGWSVEQNAAEVANSLDSVYRFQIYYLDYPPSSLR